MRREAGHRPIELILFGAPGCHLCDEARALLDPLERDHLVRVTYLNAHSTFELIQELGDRIPVIRFPDGGELGWPFSEADIRRAIQNAR